MRVLVVYESLYGTNRRIAEAIAEGVGTDAAITIVAAEEAPVVIDGDVDLVVVGGPNHVTGMPSPQSRERAAAEGDGTLRPAQRGLREWLADVRIARRGQRVAVWDTRMKSPRILDLIDRSGPTIAGRLRRGGARLVGTPRKFYSADGVGALMAGEEDRARTWGVELAEAVRGAEQRT